MYSRLQTLNGTSNSFSNARHSKVANSNRSVSVPRPARRHLCSTKASAINSDKPAANGAVVTSPHPDAVRRSREAEERRLERAAALEATLAATQGRSTSDESSNLCEIGDSSELRLKLAMGSCNNKLMVVHFKAAWCSACARMQYKVAQIAKQNPDVSFLIVDVSKDANLLNTATELGVQELPYFMFYKNKKLLSQFTCNLSKIDTLRAEIAGHKGCQEEAPDVQVYSQMEK